MYKAENHTDPGQDKWPAIVVGSGSVDDSFVRDVKSSHEGASVEQVALTMEQGNGDGQGHGWKVTSIRSIHDTLEIQYDIVLCYLTAYRPETKADVDAHRMPCLSWASEP